MFLALYFESVALRAVKPTVSLFSLHLHQPWSHIYSLRSVSIKEPMPLKTGRFWEPFIEAIQIALQAHPSVSTSVSIQLSLKTYEEDMFRQLPISFCQSSRSLHSVGRFPKTPVETADYLYHRDSQITDLSTDPILDTISSGTAYLSGLLQKVCIKIKGKGLPSAIQRQQTLFDCLRNSISWKII